MITRLKKWAYAIRRDVLMLWLAAQDPRTPWQAKVVAAVVAAYALSPIDLIPDFIPVLGYLDDLLLVPVGIWLAVKLIPADLVIDLRRRADGLTRRPVSKGAAVGVVAVWIASASGLGWVIWRALAQQFHP
ncbi:YkvA family protein [soil metagenome]